MRRLAGALAALPLIVSGCSGSGDETTTVMVPSSFTDVTTDIDKARDVEIEWVIAGSSRLVRQLEDGADADLLLTADAETMADAAVRGLVDESLGIVATNRLVLALAPGNPGGINRLEDIARPALLIGICASEVPCGRLATEAAATWDLDIAADTEEPSVRALALKIAAGELDGGLVYATDALAFNLETIDNDRLAVFETEYPAAAIGDASISFFTFLTTSEGREILRDRGFGVP
ncbi:MAG: substrate-binding domain-containing protein [Acidimicrobiales bacterium]|jgi:molybdate transport system substrate-binding protein|nr:substrate-binding domain-containing protein [Acidimicrobiales bacterium]